MAIINETPVYYCYMHGAVLFFDWHGSQVILSTSSVPGYSILLELAGYWL
jgi:hypothetical protein